jgi:hypothetical protein
MALAKSRIAYNSHPPSPAKNENTASLSTIIDMCLAVKSNQKSKEADAKS